MKRLYSVCLSVGGYVGDDLTVTAFTCEDDGEKRLDGEIRTVVPAPEAPADLRDWLRQALAAMIEEL